MINKISFKNYKIFKEKQQLQLRPITVVFGKNNSGKSAVVKLPTLIEGALNSDDREAIAAVNNGVELGAELRDLIYGKANRALELEIEFTTQGGASVNLNVGIIVTSERGMQSSIIDSWAYNKEILFQYTGKDNIYFEENSGQEFACVFNGLRLVGVIPTQADQQVITLPSLDVILETDFIGPIRIRPQRDYRVTSSPSSKSGAMGENTYFALIEDAMTSDKQLTSKVADWYQQNFEGWALRVNQDKAPLFQIEIQRESLKQNILDAGIGIHQVLPVVSRAFSPCKENTLIIIEEPETHLHPAAHGNLASLLADTVKSDNRRYLVETHSLNFILRLRRLVAEGKLSPKEVALYYVDFREEENFSVLNEVVLDDLGRVDRWPDNIFNETLDETLGIRSAQLDRTPDDN